MKKILIVFGTRPEAIKMCPLVLELQKRRDLLIKVCVTGQHKEMLQQVLDVFHVKPDYDLKVMKIGQTLFDITTSVLLSIKKVLEIESPDICLVHGDTTSAFATSLSCYYLKIPVGHVEAGLRTRDIFSPFPEEYNRRAIAIVSSLDFAPTDFARENLISEGKNSNKVFVTGNTVIDAMRQTVSEGFSHPELTWAAGSKLVFITVHRRESIGAPMHHIFRAIRRVLDEHSDVKALYPIHMNPAIREIAEQEFDGCSNIHLIEPLNVIDCHNFEAKCYLCLTDSGGIQEECPAFGKPVLVLRNKTERPEGIAAGTLRLAGTSEESVYQGFTELLDNKATYDKMATAVNPYGDGHACERIADILEGKPFHPFVSGLQK